MQVRHTVDLGGGHLIEVGGATWNPQETSVRNRYPTSDGRFNRHSSSEIPLDDLEPILAAVASHDLISPDMAARIIESLARSIERQSMTAVP